MAAQHVHNEQHKGDTHKYIIYTYTFYMYLVEK